MRRPLQLFLSLAVPIFVLDWATKAHIRANMRVGEAIDVIPGLLRMWHRTNKGAAWSLFGDQSWGMTFLTIMGVVAIVVMVWMVLKLRDDERLTAVSLGALAAGALGNLLDRIRFKEVTDFIDVYQESGPVSWFFNKIAGGDHYPTFNVADMAIVTGAILLAIEAVRGGRKVEGADAEGAEDGEAAAAS